MTIDYRKFATRQQQANFTPSGTKLRRNTNATCCVMARDHGPCTLSLRRDTDLCAKN